MRETTHFGGGTLSTGLVALGLILVASCAGLPLQSEGKQDVAGALALYSEGWAARDTDAILGLHADDTEFHLVTHGAAPARGKEEVRQAFDDIFASNPGYTSTAKSVRLGADFAVVEYDFQVDPERPARAGAVIYVPQGKSYRVPAIDVIVFRGGKVTRKTTYVDTESLRAGSRRVETAE